ncbi:unsaturated rhamnogalacturonyl hydrolase [Peteryoungia aggregata LMG 23059]|uniref:Unsaturated rhamnogalacturonyl hydrolase n=1 Tax=Peteryoungia aggregata LMG 23059 TaxID=1368425 RepID=A0ABU0G1X1_9HYPH|nr:glycoside hydrolase family 88 protein [Peteryoungia aggregata]MDQ0419327.1 unsaturated rhamnogalacturonyl hydrolase [Peteryoungia aggregata LMG 23059]
MLISYFDDYARDYEPYKAGAWCYEDGCLYRGLITLHEATGDPRWLDHLTRLVDAQLDADGGLADYRITEFNIDNIQPGHALLYLHRLTSQARYLDAARQLGLQLTHHPRIGTGPYWHKLRYPHQVWLDGLYMAMPFKIALGLKLDDQALVEEAIRQLTTALDLTFDKASGLYRHGYDESRLQDWADPDTGLSPAHWARSIGWLAMAFVDVIEHLPEGESRRDLSKRLASLNDRLAALVTSDHRWLQVIDAPDVKGNYPESSATAMFAYALQKSERLGIDRHGDLGRSALKALTDLELRPVEGRRPQLQNVCCVAGLGPFQGIYRDGSIAYYLTEAIRPDDIKGVAPLMMAEAERLLAEGTALNRQDETRRLLQPVNAV